MQLNILGTKYTVKWIPENKDMCLIDNGGYCDHTTKDIVVKRHDNPKHDDVKNINYIHTQNLRHEIIHAFLFESGLGAYSYDETLVDWIAVTMPKINQACECAENWMVKNE